MEPFVTHRGRVALLDWSDVNTDLIIPARYLKKVERTGFGPLLFADKRYVPGGAPTAEQPDEHGEEVPEFPLNDRKLEGATVLVVGHNFGCGSSREHAVWAVMQAGYRAVIARGRKTGFADIFESNAQQNGLLAVELDEPDWEAIAAAEAQEPGRGGGHDRPARADGHTSLDWCGFRRAGRGPVSLRDPGGATPPLAARAGLDRRDAAS